MNSLDGIDLHPDHFSRMDEAPDEIFYRPARLVTHIDDAACAAQHIMRSNYVMEIVSLIKCRAAYHICPLRCCLKTVVGLGMNAEELEINLRLDSTSCKI